MHQRRQQTLRRPVVIEGRGLFFGRPVKLTLMPESAGTGIIFARDDVDPNVAIPATIKRLEPSQRRTVVGVKDSRVEMVEHLLAALVGMHIDNCRVHLDGPEPPCGDGSSLHFVEAIDRAGVLVQDEFRPCIEITQTWRVDSPDGRSWIELAPPTARDGITSWTYDLDYNDAAIPNQSASFRVTPSIFTRELENMRTFVLEREIDHLQSLGLGLHATPQDLLVLQEDGTPIDTCFRAPNECARHKLLDMLGDFALLGCDLHASVHGHRSGHDLNHHAVRSILKGLEDGRCQWKNAKPRRSAA